MYAIVDIETTGGYAGNHRITEIAIIHHDGAGITDQYQTLINPERNIPSFITSLTGITNDMVINAPLFREVSDEILTWLDGKIFVAHNAQFDFSFLKREFSDAGILWSPKRLCTVRLGRKIIPGLKSYSLSALAGHLGISIEQRHRAIGDALATARVFDTMLRRDVTGEVEKYLNRNSGEMVLPPNLERSEIEQLPALPGVYYFHDRNGKIIYVGKAKDLRKRIIGHFTGSASEWNRTRVRNDLHRISFELTGTELIALLHEAQEIRRLWPRYNLAQKEFYEPWGIFSYEDRNGFIRWSASVVKKGTEPHITASSKGFVWNLIWEKIREFRLCPKLSGVQKTSGSCSEYKTGGCDGACAGREDIATYNERVRQAIETLSEGEENLLIIDKGRKRGERSVIVVQQGKFSGYGFFPSRKKITSIEEALGVINPARDNRLAMPLIRNWLVDSPSGKVRHC
jgi:DNA polymerase III subunit epsilon